MPRAQKPSRQKQAVSFRRSRHGAALHLWKSARKERAEGQSRLFAVPVAVQDGARHAFGKIGHVLAQDAPLSQRVLPVLPALIVHALLERFLHF